MSLTDLEMNVRELIEKTLENVPNVSAEKAGLDRRCGMIYVSGEFIATEIYNDKRLQYYGGFEYVDSEHRLQFGDMVFYTADSDRVYDHIELYLENHGE